MFYPEDSLKRGGQFYLCWVADSWPLQFATITHRQLWLSDIRKISDNLLAVMTNESGRPAKRFSLRLSSQLLRGLVRLYQRKVTILLGEICMINANVIKHSNKKWNIREVDIVEQVRRPQLQQLDLQEIQQILQEPPEREQSIEELIQQSGNVVANIDQITLKETTIPEILLPPDDGFGEEQPGQALQQLHDRTMEMMLVQPDVSTAAHSGLEAALDITDKSHDKSRLMAESAQMERISEHDVTLFRKPTGEDLMPEVEKDIAEIEPPELPVPEPEKPQEPVPEASSHVVEIEPPRRQEPAEIELEELEEGAPQPKRRRLKSKLIIDKKTRISPNAFRARMKNPLVELRCEDKSDDIIFIQVPAETYFRRPCHGGSKITCNLGFEITRLFSRNLGVVAAQPLAEREIEQSRQMPMRKSTRTLELPVPEASVTVPKASVTVPEVSLTVPEASVTVPEASVTVPEASVTVNEFVNVSEPWRVNAVGDMDIADIPTQKVETLSQARKRSAETEVTVSPKRQRSVGYVSFRESQMSKEKSVHITDPEADKENVPANILLRKDAEEILSSKLQEAGLADISHQPMITELEILSQTRPPTASQGKSRRPGSESSETPLGSLDRTKVSLGDSEQTTDSKRFIHDQWGTEGTMVKILNQIKGGLQPVTVTSIIAKGPVISGYRHIIAARCFTSILKLKQNGFINVKKNSDTLEITDITLGPQFD